MSNPFEYGIVGTGTSFSNRMKEADDLIGLASRLNSIAIDR